MIWKPYLTNEVVMFRPVSRMNLRSQVSKTKLSISNSDLTTQHAYLLSPSSPQAYRAIPLLFFLDRPHKVCNIYGHHELHRYKDGNCIMYRLIMQLQLADF